MRPVLDADLDRLNSFSRLEFLTLEGTDVTDNGLARLEGVTQLKYLCIGGAAKVTDAGLEHLYGLKQLRRVELVVVGTDLTDEGVRKLRAALPLCEIQAYGLQN